MLRRRSSTSRSMDVHRPLKSKSAVMVLKGTAQELLSVMLHPAASPLRRSRRRLTCHQFATGPMRCAHLFACGLYAIDPRAPGVSSGYGRAKLRCAVADSLRRRAVFASEGSARQRSIRSRRPIPSNRDAVSTAWCGAGLVLLIAVTKTTTGSGHSFKTALRFPEELVASEPPGTFEAENDIRRVAFSQPRLVSLARGAYP
jgi:hypothetical protein